MLAASALALALSRLPPRIGRTDRGQARGAAQALPGRAAGDCENPRSWAL